MVSKTYKLDIFKVIDHIRQHDYSYWDKLSEEEQKAFSPYIMIQWLSYVSEPYQVLLLNMILNPVVFTLQEHKKLLYEIMIICCVSDEKPKWIKRKSNERFPKCIEVVATYCDEPKRIAKDILCFYTNADILQMCEEMGYEKEEIKNIKKEMKLRNEIL